MKCDPEDIVPYCDSVTFLGISCSFEVVMLALLLLLTN
jgi:hypothetical protein